MFSILITKKMMSGVLLLLILGLALAGCTGSIGTQGPPGPQGPPGSPGPAAPNPAPTRLLVTPSIIDFTAKKIELVGSGFTPGSVVTVGIPGLPVSKNLPGVTGNWFGSVTVNEYGAFSYSADLTRTIFRLTRGIMTEDELAGALTVVAENERGEKAVAPLTIVKTTE